ncbi:hypothetical protein MUG91_G18n39 [Manis pentadactyla]|nr:hypothetical protein MUG91_G18n39 [Manis pentadactyla]
MAQDALLPVSPSPSTALMGHHYVSCRICCFKAKPELNLAQLFPLPTRAPLPPDFQRAFSQIPHLRCLTKEANMSLFNLWEEGKYFTELIGSEANDSVETFNSFLASQTVRLEKQSCCVFIQQQEPGVVILRKRIHWTTEKGKKELKQDPKNVSDKQQSEQKLNKENLHKELLPP